MTKSFTNNLHRSDTLAPIGGEGWGEGATHKLAKRLRPFNRCLLSVLLATATTLSPAAEPPAKTTDAENDQAEHSAIGITQTSGSFAHTQHPDAQWFPDASFGLFIHWGIASVKAMNISWPMIAGRKLSMQRITDPAERERIVRESDYNLTGHPPAITPNEYWEMAKDFNPQKYDPELWLKAAKSAGFTYAVLTTRHHEGFALWPSAYGNFDTKNFMNGRDLVKDYVEACRHNGLKVGFYYSPPDWNFDRDYFNFLYHGSAKLNPELPQLDADLKPRTTKKTPAEIAEHRAAYAALVKGQVEELLTRYGKIDLLWFDGKPSIPDPENCITIERIRELQPGIVIDERLHGHGDFVTNERKLGTHKDPAVWTEECDTWTSSWSHQELPFRAPGYVLGELATCRSVHENLLLGVGPMASGEFCEGIYQNMAIVADWMKQNGASVKGTQPLPKGETASVPATAAGNTRYLFLIPRFANNGQYERDLLPSEDLTVSLRGASKPAVVKLSGDATPLEFTYADQTVSIKIPAAKRTKLVDVVQIDLLPAN